MKARKGDRGRRRERREGWPGRPWSAERTGPRRLRQEPQVPAPSAPSFGPGSPRRLRGRSLHGEGRALSASN